MILGIGGRSGERGHGEGGEERGGDRSEGRKLSLVL